jgi:hypothetical protein
LVPAKDGQEGRNREKTEVPSTEAEKNNYLPKGIFDNLEKQTTQMDVVEEATAPTLLEVANLDSPGFDLPISLKGRWILRNLWRWKVYHLNA